MNKDEIQDKVWPGMIVTEAALTRAIMKARRAVGDSASKQAFIRTVHGHGYQFVATLSSEEAAAETPGTDSDSVSTSARTRMIAIAAAVAVAVVVLIAFLWPGKPPRPCISRSCPFRT